jgi:hypothetical protein
MTTSITPVRLPERPQPATRDSGASRPASWRQEKKPSRFVIKIAGNIPC